MHSKDYSLFLLNILSLVRAMTTTNINNYIGFDLGTSGARMSIINENSGSVYNEIYSDATLYLEYDDPTSWTDAIHILLKNTPKSLLSNTQSICVSGTSASCLLVNRISGKVTRPAKMYDYDITHLKQDMSPTAAIKATSWVDKHAPKNHATRAATSALSKLLHYHACHPIKANEVLAHQSEYVAATMFMSNPKKGRAETAGNTTFYTSDWHNALKLGYDVKKLRYPEWLLILLEEIGIDANVLPKVVEPGKVIGQLSSPIIEEYGFSKDAVFLVGGTTDSNAAFLAAAAAGGSLPKYGVAVTSLGSTLAMKMLSRTFVEDSKRGVYSHRFPVLGGRGSSGEEAWLVGGASNVGCAILRHEKFSNEELVKLSKDMDVSTISPLEYYPLTKIGERFPYADGTKEPVLTPKPESRAEYLKGILYGISNVERLGFETLGELGANPSFPEKIWTAGGGARNDSWLKMREILLRQSFSNDKLEVRRAENAEASFGAAVLAASSFS